MEVNSSASAAAYCTCWDLLGCGTWSRCSWVRLLFPLPLCLPLIASDPILEGTKKTPMDVTPNFPSLCDDPGIRMAVLVTFL